MSAKLLVIAASVLSFSLAASSAPASFIQQGPKLVGTGAVGNSGQGSSVAVSADGNTALVGGRADNADTGAVWVYARSGGAWSQQGAKLVGTGAVVTPAAQGTSVAVSADGNTAVVGGSLDNQGAGATWVYTRSGGVWSQQAKLVGTGAVGSAASQGSSVAVSADGNTAVVGGPNDNADAGAAWVFTRSGTVWSQQGSKLVGTGGLSQPQRGAAVKVSADGNTAIVGGPNDNSGAGAAWVWTRSGSVWSQQGAKLVGTGAVGSARQGYSVSVSTDGNTAVMGGLDDNSFTGAAWVFTRSGVTWSQQAKLVGTGAVGAAAQGVSVALSGDGNTAVVGGPSDDIGDPGAAWVFTRSGGVWTQPRAKLVGTGAVGGARQGSSVAVSADGSTAVVGGTYDNGFVGAAWVYSNDPSVPSLTTWGMLALAMSLAGGGLVIGLRRRRAFA